MADSAFRHKTQVIGRMSRVKWGWALSTWPHDHMTDLPFSSRTFHEAISKRRSVKSHVVSSNSFRRLGERKVTFWMGVPQDHFLKLSPCSESALKAVVIHSLVSIPRLHPDIGHCISWEFDIVCLDLKIRPNSLTRNRLGKWFQLSLKRRWKGSNSQNSQLSSFGWFWVSSNQRYPRGPWSNPKQSIQRQTMYRQVLSFQPVESYKRNFSCKIPFLM